MATKLCWFRFDQKIKVYKTVHLLINLLLIYCVCRQFCFKPRNLIQDIEQNELRGWWLIKETKTMDITDLF